MDYSGCSSEKDLVTFVDWVDDAPNIMINFKDDPSKSGRLNCYNGDSLKYWLNQKENTFAKWIQRRPGYPIEDMGHGGMPDPSHKYIKLYTGEYVVDDEIIDKLKQGVKYPVILDADFVEIERIGNLRGEFGVGDVHGQLPGYRVYQLETDKPLELNDEEDDVIERTIQETREYRAERGSFTAAQEEEILTKISDAIIDGHNDAYVAAVQEYIDAAPVIKKKGLVNKILFMITQDSPLHRVHKDAKEHLEYITDIIDVDVNFLSTDIFKAQVRIRWIITDVGQFMIDQEIYPKTRRLFAFKYPNIMDSQYMVIEAVARTHKDEAQEDSIIKKYYEEFKGENLRKMYLAILVRAKIIGNDGLLENIRHSIDNNEWGIVDDSEKYKEILSREVTTPDTFETMEAFYKNLDNTNEDDI